MNEPSLNLRTTSQIITQSSSTFLKNLPTYLFLSLLLFTFRTIVETSTLTITTFIDEDPSLKSLLTHLDLSGKNAKASSSSSLSNHHTRRGGRPFLQLSRVGTLDDDFFSSEENDDRQLLGIGKKFAVNASTVNLSNFGKLGFYGFQFEVEELNDVVESVEGNEDRVSEGVELGRRDAAMLVFLVSFLSAVYGWVILGFVIVNTCVVGVVFYSVVSNSYLGRYDNSFVGTVWAGCRLGARRLSGFILMRWAIRDAMTQIIGVCFFGEIEDQHSFFKIFVRLKLMPFSITFPWIRGYELEISRFLFTWILSDTVVGLVFAVDYWVAIMDARRGREILKEGFYLLSTMMSQAISLKGYEAFFCSSYVRWVLTQIFGNLFASMFQSVVEVYFMVVWLIYYFSAKSKDASADGRRFERKDLEDYIDGLR
ncbi:hypothetical protein IFM89_034757 [Coptis chinensis]|uniref:Uncharacterized protein n=1 Tax=Coptis chinensis TaxID=261450 RepID=A0A835LKC1_9MAGN|nr:hypothetical protein IFM89_034757 [Coptis chinensis]